MANIQTELNDFIRVCKSIPILLEFSLLFMFDIK